MPASALLKVSDPFWGSQLAPTARRTAAWPPAVAPKLPVLSSLTAARSLTGSGSGFDGVSMPYGKAAALASGHSRLVAAGSKAASTFTHQEMASKVLLTCLEWWAPPLAALNLVAWSACAAPSFVDAC